MAAELTSTTEGQTLVLTLHNPQRHNTLSPEIYSAGVEALNGAERGDEIRSVVLTGEGTMFSAGGDLNRLKANRTLEPHVQAASIDALHNWIETISAFPKPIVAAVEGAAAGAGFSLALACDFVIASRSARFSLAYTRVGLSPDGGASWALARALPPTLAAEWLMLGEPISAEQLSALGLVNRLSEPGSALADALKFCVALNARAPNVLTSIKELVRQAPTQELHMQLAAEQTHFIKNLQHPNAGEGINAFLEKRAPQFR